MADSAFDIGRDYDWERFEPLIKNGYRVDVSRYLSQGWELFKRKPGEFIGYLVLTILIGGMASVIPGSGIVIEPPLTAGFLVVCFLLIKGKNTEFGDFFGGFKYFLPVVLAGILVGIFCFVGFLLLIIPGIYLAVSYMFVTQLIVDKRMNFWQAMEVSRRVITKKWFSIFWLAVVIILINIVGALMLLVGLLVTVPWSHCIMAAAYADIIGLEHEKEEGQEQLQAE